MGRKIDQLKDDRNKRKKVAHIHINQKWCKGCYLCLAICPKKVFEKSKEVSEKGFHPVAIVHAEECTRCLQCEMLCPDLAIDVEKEN
jgi:2-oxoglutarate ferredoxin oxidoreductase subunit delta